MTPKEGGEQRVAKRARKDDAPSIKLILLPFVVSGAAMLVAGFHKWLGEPLGPTAAAKMWDVAQTLMLMLVAYGPAAGYVQRQNTHAAKLAEDHRQRDRTRDRQRLPTGSNKRITRSSSGSGEEGNDDDDDDRQRRLPDRTPR